MKNMALIYHFSANPQAAVCKKHIHELQDFADSQGYNHIRVYCDSSLKKGQQTEYIRLLNEAEPGDTVFIKDLFHINKWTQKAFLDVSCLNDKGVSVFSMNDGCLNIDGRRAFYDQALNVCFYHSNLRGTDERHFDTQLSIAQLFCREKTRWNISGVFYDEAKSPNVSAQPNLEKLTGEASDYDLLMVGSFSRVDLRTARFMKSRRMLHLPIFSLQEGMLPI